MEGTRGLWTRDYNSHEVLLYKHKSTSPTHRRLSSLHRRTGKPKADQRNNEVHFVLAIAVPACNANLFYADAPKPQMEVLTDAFWDYISKATQTADDTLQMIRKSQLGEEINGAAQAGAGRLRRLLDSEGLKTALVQKSEELQASLEQSVKDLQAQLGPYTDDLKMKVDQHLQDFQDS
ncbi:hypothetical protein WMY93_026913, partial [Mugilogobius chulae]